MKKSKRLKRAKLKTKQLNLIRYMRKIELSKTPKYIKVNTPTKPSTELTQTDNQSPPPTEQKVVRNPAHLYLKYNFKPYKHLQNKKFFKQLKKEA